MTRTLDFCSEPDGYSQRQYNDAVLSPSYSPGGSSTTGFHLLDTANCRLRYWWPRASDGAPSYARINFTDATLTDTPDFGFDINGSWDSDNFSWGSGLVGIGDPGVGHGFLTGARIYVRLWNDDDNNPWGPKVQGTFVNVAGTAFSTPIIRLPDSGRVFTEWGIDTSVHVYVDGGTGFVVTGSGTSTSVALSGDFTSTYSQWMSYHGGGGGGSSNGGQSAGGEFTSLRVAGTIIFSPTIGTIGLGAF